MGNPLLFSCIFWLSILFVGVWHLSITISGQCLDDQRSLLLQLKQGLSIDPPTDSKLTSWTSTTNCCLWDGVTCDPQTGHVIWLDLSNRSITGGINSSSSLFSLHHLQRLNLAFNIHISSFPSGFGRLSSLTHLNLSYSGFFGQVPVEISFLKLLVSLDLSSPSLLRAEIIELHNPDLKGLIENLTSLRELHLDGIDISKVGRRWCQILSSTLPNLRVLSLSMCNLVGPIHPSLSKLQRLTHLNLNGNNLPWPVPDFLTKLTSLTSLHLSYCGFYGTFPNDIFMIHTLHTLDISDNFHLSGSLSEFLPRSALRVINLSGTMFSGKLPKSINNLAFLQDLQLRNCSFFGSIPSSIEKLTELVYLDLSSNSFSGPIPSLASSRKITGLIFSHNGFTGTIPMSFGETLKNLEILDLRNNSLQGMIPSSLFENYSIKLLLLGQNRLDGQLQEFQNASSSSLREIDLSRNKLQGVIPMSIFKLGSLNVLLLSSNLFNGSLTLNMFKGVKELAELVLCDNNLSFNVNSGDSTIFSHITRLGLSSCNIHEFPNFLRNQTYLYRLDLSNNRIKGEIPNWIWELGSGNLVHLNLSHNMLHGFGKPGLNLSSSFLAVLDLHSNMLQGPLLMPPPTITFLDYSDNRFTSTVPSDFFNYLYYPVFISLRRNNLTGEFPSSICVETFLEVLDLSNNQLNGSIPQCVGSDRYLRVLKLRNNEFLGMVPQTFGKKCSLRTLDLSQNQLEGRISRSLANCASLDILDVGNNHINRWRNCRNCKFLSCDPTTLVVQSSILKLNMLS